MIVAKKQRGAKNREETEIDANPFLTQAGLLRLHSQARNAHNQADQAERRAHLYYILHALITLAERHGPTPEYLHYVTSIQSNKCPDLASRLA